MITEYEVSMMEMNDGVCFSCGEDMVKMYEDMGIYSIVGGYECESCQQLLLSLIEDMTEEDVPF